MRFRSCVDLFFVYLFVILKTVRRSNVLGEPAIYGSYEFSSADF